MKKLILSLSIAAVAVCCMAAPKNNAPMQVDITPLPVSVMPVSGNLLLNSRSTLRINAPEREVDALQNFISCWWRNFAPAAKGRATVTLSIVESLPEVDNNPEGYTVSVTKKGIDIKATTGTGLYYGVRTVVQMAHSGDTVPCAVITDYPRFAYRGIMLDISRHNRNKAFILKQIEAMAALKLNRLHLHLTDAAGWRLEIKKYPRLTDYAAWRPQATWSEWNNSGAHYVEKGSAGAFGGYLTQDDAREIVDYAALHRITVVPEIEMPSHSNEVTAAYPHLSCTGNPDGEPDVCIGNDSTFAFFENVLDEVFSIFPSHYIHIGGDEASKKAWKSCPRCRARMDSLGLENVDQLQSYMIHRIERFVNSRGRDIIGWDEIMEGGLAPNATVMSWRGIDGGIRAARAGHRVVMTPGSHCYFDQYQDAPPTQPKAIGGYLPLKAVYSYNPVPDSIAGWATPFIDGVQANLWCEYIPTSEHAEYMLYPRAIALAEVAWSPQQRREWSDFRRRVVRADAWLVRNGFNTFNLADETGPRRESLTPERHLARGAKVTYNNKWWSRYTAAGVATLTDGLRGDWNYTDGRWQGFTTRGDYVVDVTIDLAKSMPIKYIGAEFMQITGPGVWFPSSVKISVSADGKIYRELKQISTPAADSEGLSFRTYQWSGASQARYIRFQSTPTHGVQFLDEIVVR